MVRITRRIGPKSGFKPTIKCAGIQFISRSKMNIKIAAITSINIFFIADYFVSSEFINLPRILSIA